MTVGQSSMEWDGVASCPACMPIRQTPSPSRPPRRAVSESLSRGRYSYPAAMLRDCDVGSFGKGTGRLKIRDWI